jgi:hypothetical protein
MTRLLIGTITILLLTDCGSKCKNIGYEKHSINNELLSYFGVFEIGNYWVYENTAKTKKDSIYVTNTNSFVRQTNVCWEEDVLQFTLQATGKDVITKEKACMQSTRSDILFQTCDNDSLFFNILGGISFGTQLYSTSQVELINNITLNNSTYNGDIIMILSNGFIIPNDTLYIMKDKGIIGWKKNNDTYNVTQYLIQ